MSTYLVSGETLTAIADKIREKSGGADQLSLPDGFLQELGSIPSAGSIEASDITFYDYDGVVVDAWRLDELPSKVALPDFPEHNGLICQGWNWSLADLKATNKPMNVGATYITDDGATRLHVLFDSVYNKTAMVGIQQSKENGVTIDWGDGATETNSSLSFHASHTYDRPGRYVVSLMPSDDCTFKFIRATNSFPIIDAVTECNIGRNMTSLDASTFYQLGGIKRITIPENVTSIGTNIFGQCRAFAAITLHKNITSFGARMLTQCLNLETVSIPNGVQIIPASAFNGCYRLRSVTMPDSVVEIGSAAFTSCRRIPSVVMPPNITAIGNSAFSSCSALTRVDFSACTSVPSLGTGVFATVASGFEIIVPENLLDEWKTATNWSDYADKIKAE